MKPVETKVRQRAVEKEGVERAINREIVPTLQATVRLVNLLVSGREKEGATDINWSRSNFFGLTLTDNATLTFTTPDGVGVYVLRVLQDSSGGHTISWPSTVKWSLGIAPALTGLASSEDMFFFYFDGTSFNGIVAGLDMQ